jgi:hypothetical protein
MLVRQVTPDDLEPELIAIVKPILDSWKAAALRVAANDVSPKIFALPKKKDTPEAILGKRFAKIAKERPAIASAVSGKAEDVLRKRNLQGAAGDLLSADFTRTTSIQDELPAPTIDEPKLIRLIERHYSALGFQRTSSAEFPSQKQVHLDLVRMVCIDETNGFLGSEWGQDEIYLAVATIGEDASTDQVPPFRVGDFDDGTRKDFTPRKRLYSWKVLANGKYPKHYFATLLLWEKDNGDLDETFEDIFKKVTDQVAKKIATILGTAIGGVLAGPLGAAIGALVGWLVSWLMNKIVSFLIQAWEDDPFIPRTIEFIIPDANSYVSQPSKVFHFTGPGEYAVRYRFAVSSHSQVATQ